MAKRKLTLEEAKKLEIFAQVLDNLFPGWEYMESDEFKVLWDIGKEMGYVPS
jgi:hypothetical protein